MHTMYVRKVVLVSNSVYAPNSGDAVLRQFIDDKIELFCVVGVDAAKWEEALDWLCIDPKANSVHFITTTSHPNESVEEVIAFAESFQCETTHAVQLVYV